MSIATYAGKGASKVFGHSTKKTSHSAKKGVRIQSPLSRKPLSPVSSTVLSKANIKNSIQNVATKPIPQKSEELTGTPPSKPFITGIEDSVPSTPLTVHKLNITTPDSWNGYCY